MSHRDRREHVALGVSLALCFVLVLIALSGIRGTTSVASVEVAEAQGVSDDTTETTSSIPSANGPVEIPVVEPTTVARPPSCVLSGVPLGFGTFGEDAFCLQNALISAGFLAGTASGVFDEATIAAVAAYQTENAQRVDGVVGRITGTSLGIWPPDPFTVQRTPVPAPGATDVWGMPLSTVATSGPDAPPLPPDSGSGYRLVYHRAAQRVWAVDDDDTVIRSWLVSGSRADNEIPGTHRVYSRSATSVSLDGESSFSYMVRWLRTADDAIGFHSLPRRTVDDSLYQSDDELGIRLSSGCQRQADLDAEFTWRFAGIGTVVVVI